MFSILDDILKVFVFLQVLFVVFVRKCVQRKISTCTALILLCEFGYIPHTKNGFYCGDTKISFPFKKDTCSVTMLMGSVILFPYILIYILEIIFYQAKDHKTKISRCQASRKITSICYSRYFLGFAINLAIVEICKNIIGELRPHFLASCTPDAVANCTKGDYIEEFTCTNNANLPSWNINDATKSFPSGHASLSVYYAIFMIYYLHRRISTRRRKSVIVVMVLQCLLSAFCIFASVSRITDYRHHWWDVLSGVFLGIAIAIVMIKNLDHQLRVDETSPGDSISKIDMKNENLTLNKSTVRLLETSS